MFTVWELAKGWSGKSLSRLMRLGLMFTALLFEATLSGERLKN